MEEETESKVKEYYSENYFREPKYLRQLADILEAVKGLPMTKTAIAEKTKLHPYLVDKAIQWLLENKLIRPMETSSGMHYVKNNGG